MKYNLDSFEQLVESAYIHLNEEDIQPPATVTEPIQDTPQDLSNNTASALPELTSEKEVALVQLAVRMLFLDKNSPSIEDAVKSLTDKVTVENVREVEDKLNQIDSITTQPVSSAE